MKTNSRVAVAAVKNKKTAAVNFYDKDGNLLNTVSATKQNLEAGEIWQFNIRFTSPDAWENVNQYAIL